jgi:hypothetical protein
MQSGADLACPDSSSCTRFSIGRKWGEIRALAYKARPGGACQCAAAQTAPPGGPNVHRPGLGCWSDTRVDFDIHSLETTMNYEDRDTYGMYTKHDVSGPGPDDRRGPGPEMMGAETLLGNDVVNQKGEDLGDIKEIMLDLRNGTVAYAVLSFRSSASVPRPAGWRRSRPFSPACPPTATPAWPSCWCSTWHRTTRAFSPN